MRTPTWDDRDHWGRLLLISAILLIDGVLMLLAGLKVVGIAGVVAAAAIALNALYLRAVNDTGTVPPPQLWARSVANAGYLAALTALVMYNLGRVIHPGALGWFWGVLNFVFAVILTVIAVRFLMAWASGRRPDSPAH